VGLRAGLDVSKKSHPTGIFFSFVPHLFNVLTNTQTINLDTPEIVMNLKSFFHYHIPGLPSRHVIIYSSNQQPKSMSRDAHVYNTKVIAYQAQTVRGLIHFLFSSEQEIMKILHG
jgi:hypothetical protein